MHSERRIGGRRIIMSALLLLSATPFLRFCLRSVTTPTPKNEQTRPVLSGRRGGRALFQETQKFLARIEQSGSLPSVEVPNLHVQIGEFVLLRESGVSLAALETVHVPIGKTREAAIAGLQFYPRGWKTEHTKEEDLLASGDLYLTTRRLLFISDRRTVSLPWRDLVDSHGFLDSLKVSTTDSDVAFSL